MARCPEGCECGRHHKRPRGGTSAPVSGTGLGWLLDLMEREHQTVKELAVRVAKLESRQARTSRSPGERG
jgi:hypothetical protein